MARYTAKDLLGKKRAVTTTYTLVLDSEVADRWNAAEQALANAKLELERKQTDAARGAVADAEDVLDQIRPELAGATMELKLRSVGRQLYDELIEKHPATDEARKEAKKRGEQPPPFDAESFTVALLAASLVDPEMTEDEVQEMFDSEQFNSAELTGLSLAAMSVNQTSKVVDIKKGFGQTPD